MSKFKVGDKVKLVSSSATETNYGWVEEMTNFIGGTFEVSSVDNNSVHFKGDYYTFHVDDLEPVLDYTPLKLEDAVVERTEVIIRKADDSEYTMYDSVNDQYVGEYGLITDKDVCDGDVYVLISEEDDNEIGFWTMPENLEVVNNGTLTDTEEDCCSEDNPCTCIDEFFLDTEEEEEEPTAEYIITGDSVTLTIGDSTEVIVIGDANYEEVRTLCLEGNYTEAMALMNVGEGITQWGNGLLEIDNGEVTYNGMKMTGKLVDRIITMMSQGDELFERFAKFLNLTQEQESFKTRERLMDFAAHDKLDLDENGYVVAFKNVRGDYFDKHSGKFRNQVGDSPSMPRSEVDDDHNHQCSRGLHVCSPTYLQGFWGKDGKNVRVVVNPRDFVAIPYDYNDSKARVCKYTVVEDITGKEEEYGF